MPPQSRKPLVLGARPVDAEVTPPPAGYVPPQDASPAEETVAPPTDAAPDPSPGDAPAGDAPDPRDLEAADDAAQRSARNAQNGDDDQADDGDGETEYRYASENQVQAARLVLRSFAKARDAVTPKANAARAAIAELQQMGGNLDQVRMVLADARVKPREIGLKADGTPVDGAR
jgi:hypothetical protein